MKRAYVKPGMYVENFALSQSIAASGCGAAHDSTLGAPNMADKTTCGWIIGGDSIWTDTVTNCTSKRDADFDFGVVCYNNPNGGTAIFYYS